MSNHFENLRIVRPDVIREKRDDLQYPPIKLLKHAMRVARLGFGYKHTDIWPIGNFVARLIGKKTMDTRCADGRWLSFPLPVYTVYFLQGGDHKRYNRDNIHPVMKKLAKPGTVAIDVGASCGQEVVTLSRKVGANGMVYCFEPSFSFEALLRTVGLNELSNVVCVNAGCGATNGFIEGQKEKLYYTGAKTSYTAQGAPVVRIDDFLKHMGETRPVSLIKIDTDGFEYEVIQGAMETIGRDHPDVIAEYEPCFSYSGLKDKAVLQRYLDMGFSIQKIQTTMVAVGADELEDLVQSIPVNEDMIAHDIVLSLKRA